MQPIPESVRLDKFLWAIRLFKSRSLATEACARGKILINDQPAKPSRVVKINDVIQSTAYETVRIVKVIALLEKRVSAKLVGQYVEDLSPAPVIAAVSPKILQPFVFRPKGSGRPTKKDRRALTSFAENDS